MKRIIPWKTKKERKVSASPNRRNCTTSNRDMLQNRNSIDSIDNVSLDSEGIKPPSHDSIDSLNGSPQHEKIASVSYDMNNFKDQVKALEKELTDSRAENDSKDKLIQSLQQQLERRDALLGRNINLESQLANYLLTRTNNAGTQMPHSRSEHRRTIVPLLSNSGPARDFSTPRGQKFSPIVPNLIFRIHQWLFLEGIKQGTIEQFLTKYCEFCRGIGVPVDRLFLAGTKFHPQLSPGVWRWEFGEDFLEHDIAPEDLDPPNCHPDEPFAILLNGRAKHCRIKASDKVIPPGCTWFVKNNYQDCYALPICQDTECKGAIAWGTKSARGFSEDHIGAFSASVEAFSAVLRCYTNDLVVNTLMGRLDEEIMVQTMELASANESLANANAKIIQQSQSQLRNFAMMSHEIRTPLNCIIGLSNLLLDSDLDAAAQDSLKMITSSGDLLLAVVNDVLDYSKLASGKVETKIGETDLKTTVNAVISSVITGAKANGLELRVNISSELPLTLETDGRRLQQILYNLLGNAVKFGKGGKYVDFTVGVMQSKPPSSEKSLLGDGAPILSFSIKDYGKGIPPEELKRIFEPFQQSANNEPEHGGTGLGLAITRQLVRVLGGTITVESKYGSWSEFRVLLPTTAPTTPPLPITAAPSDDEDVEEDESIQLVDAIPRRESLDLSAGNDHHQSRSCFDEDSLEIEDVSSTSYDEFSVSVASSTRNTRSMKLSASSPTPDARVPLTITRSEPFTSNFASAMRQHVRTPSLSGESGCGVPRTTRRPSLSTDSCSGAPTLRRPSISGDSCCGVQRISRRPSISGDSGRRIQRMTRRSSLNALSDRAVPKRATRSTSDSSFSFSNTVRKPASVCGYPNNRTASFSSDCGIRIPMTVNMTNASWAEPNHGIRRSPFCGDLNIHIPNAIRTNSTSDSSTDTRTFESSELPVSEDANLNQEVALGTDSQSNHGVDHKRVLPVQTFDLGRLRVLIAEDNLVNQKVLGRTLTRIGIQHVDIVDNGKKAVDSASAKNYDVIFMDLQMPIMDGLEATRIITNKRNAKSERFPKIAFLTAHALQNYQDQAADAGGDGFISKPFKMDMIKELLRRFMME